MVWSVYLISGDRTQIEGVSLSLVPSQADGWAADHFKVKFKHLYRDDDQYRKV